MTRYLIEADIPWPGVPDGAPEKLAEMRGIEQVYEKTDQLSEFYRGTVGVVAVTADLPDAAAAKRLFADAKRIEGFNWKDATMNHTYELKA